MAHGWPKNITRRQNVVEDIINMLNHKSVRKADRYDRGKVLEYLGITIDYTIKGKVKISMYK